jgi:hypothetical protein
MTLSDHGMSRDATQLEELRDVVAEIDALAGPRPGKH